MRTALEVLGLFVNPWTILVMLFIILFRRELRYLMRGLRTFAENLEEVRFKDMRMTRMRKAALTQRLREAGARENTEEQKGVLNDLVQQVETRLTESQVAVFLNLFGENDTVVIAKQKYANELCLLSQAGLISFRQRLWEAAPRRELEEWQVTGKGSVLRSVSQSTSSSVSTSTSE